MEWFSYAVAVILFLSSVISPWLVNKENNKHQLSLKKLDMYEDAKRKSLNNFINSASRLSSDYCNDNLDKYHYSLACLYIYFKEIPTEIKNLEGKYYDDSYFSELTSIVQVLSKQIAKE